MKFNLIFTTAFLVYYLLNHIESKKGRKVLILFVTIEIVIQAVTSILLFYSDNLRYEEDKGLARQISMRIQEQNLDVSKPVVFLGKHTAKTSILRGEMLGVSFFEWDMETVPRNNIRIHGFLNTQGIYYKQPTIEEIVSADEKSIDMENCPSKKAIKETDELILVKLEEE